MSSNIPELNSFKIAPDKIKLATNNFADHNFLGKGGFGGVYKGQLPVSTSSGEPAGTINVAVKRLEAKYGQGEREFLMEILMLARYKHDNLATLIGFCDEGGEKIIVYKLEDRGSLDKYLANTDFTWLQRLRICLGAARGLNYLHGVGSTHKVLIHRDIKSANILLDAKWEAKISDFGLSTIGLTNQESSFLITNACGTPGYVDPQYVETYLLTEESDVYSFGVVLFEVLCGRHGWVKVLSENDEPIYLYELVKLHYGMGTFDEIMIFPNLREQMKPSSLEAFSRIAYQCLNEDKKRRPTMRSIVQELETALELQTNITKTTLWGSSKGGSPWSFRLEGNQKLRKIFIDHERWIYSIAFATEDLRDSLHYFQQHGGNKGPSGYRASQINFDPDEEIIGIQGTIIRVPTIPSGSLTLLSSLCLSTNKKKHGPFGHEEEGCFSESWDVGSFRGFYGRAGTYLDGLGCFLRAIP